MVGRREFRSLCPPYRNKPHGDNVTVRFFFHFGADGNDLSGGACGMLDESPVGVSVVGTPLAVPLPLAPVLHPVETATETTRAVKTMIFFIV
jgi:hypothetical protein